MDLGLFELFCDFLKGLLCQEGIDKLESLLQKAEIPGVSKSHRIRNFATEKNNKLNGGDVALLVAPLTWMWEKIFKNPKMLRPDFVELCDQSRPSLWKARKISIMLLKFLLLISTFHPSTIVGYFCFFVFSIQV